MTSPEDVPQTRPDQASGALTVADEAPARTGRLARGTKVVAGAIVVGFLTGFSALVAGSSSSPPSPSYLPWT